jgi:hypothetical protein
MRKQSMIYLTIIYYNNKNLVDDYHDYRIREYIKINPESSSEEAEYYLTYQTDYKNEVINIYKPYIQYHSEKGIYKFHWFYNFIFYIIIFLFIFNLYKMKMLIY